jgi:hypothetical protein
MIYSTRKPKETTFSRYFSEILINIIIDGLNAAFRPVTTRHALAGLLDAVGGTY